MAHVYSLSLMGFGITCEGFQSENAPINYVR